MKSSTREDTVTVSVHVAAEVNTVWKFLSDGARFGQWIGAFAGQAPLAGTTVEPRVGGKIRVEYPGNQFGVGRFTAVEAPRSVAFTWGYEGGTHGMQPDSTRIEISLTPAAGGTRVELRHFGIPNDEARSGHRGGWTHYLAMLARNAADGQNAESLPRVVDAWYAAWSEPDETKRLKLLDAACEPDVRVRTSFACTDDAAALSGHIANGQKHMPGMTLKAAGAPQHLHGAATSPWSVCMPDGNAVMRGTNFMKLSSRGRIVELFSFPGG